MNIYVSNLSFQTSEPQLRELFKTYGEVASVKIVSDNFTGRSRGFGFVEMADNSEATEAIKHLNNTKMGSHFITVSEARPRENRRNF
jgi:RNA recognition motif-containing protein